MKGALRFGIVASAVVWGQIVAAQSPGGDSEWSAIHLQLGHGVEVTTHTAIRRGQLARVDSDDLVISSGSQATTVDRSDVCRVTTFESTVVRRANQVLAAISRYAIRSVQAHGALH